MGTKRRSLLIESEGCFFIGPDNGIFSLALEGKEPSQIIELSDETYHLKPTSATFHGRDIFAPIAGYLSLGFQPRDLGDIVKTFERLPWPKVIKTKDVIQGEVIYIDGFGNLITNVQADDLKKFQPESLTVSLGSLAIQGLAANYASGDERGHTALINSWGLLEVSLFKGNVHLHSGARIGDVVKVRGS